MAGTTSSSQPDHARGTGGPPRIYSHRHGRGRAFGASLDGAGRRVRGPRRFGEAYTDPVAINGVDVPLSDLVERARGLQRAFADLRIELIEQIEAPGRVVIVFWQRGRHIGPLETPLGEISPTGREVEIRVIDVLSITDGRISAIQVVPDNLALAMQLGAVRLVEGATHDPRPA